MAAPSCPFFNKLPAELRITIYELAFTSTTQEDQEVNLRDATPPSKALILTCRQAHSEAQQIFKTAFRDYWTQTTFKVEQIRDRQEIPRLLDEHSTARPVDIEHITKIKVIHHLHGGRCCVYALMDTRGFWDARDLPVKDVFFLLCKGAADDLARFNVHVIRERERERQFEAAMADRVVFPSMMEQLTLMINL